MGKSRSTPESIASSGSSVTSLRASFSVDLHLEDDKCFNTDEENQIGQPIILVILVRTEV